MLGTHKPQQQATQMKKIQIPETILRFRSRNPTKRSPKSWIFFFIAFACNGLCDDGKLNQGQKRYPKELLRQRFLPNFRVNFLVRFASKPLFYWVVPSNCSENSLVLFVRFFGFGVLFWPLIKGMSARKMSAANVSIMFLWFVCGGDSHPLVSSAPQLL